MPELPSVDGKRVVSAFENAGFEVVRITGSHHVMRRDGHRFVLSVPIHGKKAVKPGTLRGLIRGSGLTVEEFLGFLS